MPNSVPYEIIAGAPIAVYLAPADTAKVALDTVPSGAWSKLGLSGDLNYDSGGGVTIEHPQTVNPWRALGETGVRKRFRQEEDLVVNVKVVDLRLETYAAAINFNEVRTIAEAGGVPEHKRLGLSRGLSVASKAMIIRLLVSPYGDDWIGQYYFPRVQEIGAPSVAFMKGDPAGLELQFGANVDPNAAREDERHGLLEFQTDDTPT